MAAEDRLILLTGPIFMGTIFGWCLLGALVTQIYVYFLHYPDDSRILKCLVAGLFVLELLQTAFITHYAWEMLLGKWGKNVNSNGLPWSASTLSIMIALISTIVQTYYAWRLYVLRLATNYPKVVKIVSICILMVALVQGFAGMYGGIVFALSSKLENMISLTWTVELWLGGSFACDVLIAVSMIAVLAEARRSSPSNHIGAMVNKLVLHTIETGALTAITALVDLVLFELFKDTGLHQVPTAVLGKLYTNALMVSLNGRKHRLSSVYVMDQRSALRFRQSSINAFQQQSAMNPSQLRTFSLIAGGPEMEYTLPDNTSDYTEEPISKVPIIIEMPKSLSGSISEDGDIGNELSKTMDSPV